MNIKIRPILSVLLLSFILVVSESSFVYAQFDPAKATVIQFGQPFDYKLKKDGAIHFFKFTLPDEGVMFIKVTPRPKELTELRKIKMSTINTNDLRSLRAPWLWLKDHQHFSFVEPKGDQYFFMQTKGGVDNTTYRIEVNYYPLEAAEPDDSIQQSRNVEFGQSYPVKFVPYGDRDYFKIIAPADGFISWDIEGFNKDEAETEQPFIELSDQNGEIIAQDQKRFWVSKGTYHAFFQSSIHKTYMVTTESQITFSFEGIDMADDGKVHFTKSVEQSGSNYLWTFKLNRE